MKYLYSNIVLLFLCSILFAQNEFGEMESDPALLLQEANYQYQDRNYLHALEKFELLDSLTPDNIDVKYPLAICYLDVFRHLDKAIQYLKDVKEERPEDAEVVFNLAKAYHFSNDVDRAKDYYKEALSIGFEDTVLRNITKRKIEMCDNAVFYLENPTNASIVNIGDVVNTQYSEYVPIFSKDSSTLVFTYRGPGCTGGLQSSHGAKADNRGFYYEDVFIAYRYDQSWTIPVSISDNINTNLHDAVTGLSNDEKSIFVYRSNGSNGEIFESTKDGDDWTKPKKLDKTINSKYFEGHAAFTKDGNIMYVTSDRPGGYGGIDIYKSEKDDRGYWGELENLGPRINTKYDEDAPFIYTKGNVIYFSSKGHNSMGGYDVFRSFYFDGNWTEPQNLGYPINTTDDDIYFSVSANGKVGYMGSKRAGGYGLLDIYRMDLSNLKIPFMPVEFDSSFLDAFLEEIVEEDTVEEIVEDTVAEDTTMAIEEVVDDSWKDLSDDELYAYLLEKFGNVKVDGLIFNIQIGAYRNPLGENANLLAVADDVRTQKFNDLITRYFSGKFEVLSRADAYRNQMIDLGVSDAFVVAFKDGEKLYLRQLAELLHSTN